MWCGVVCCGVRFGLLSCLAIDDLGVAYVPRMSSLILACQCSQQWAPERGWLLKLVGESTCHVMSTRSRTTYPPRDQQINAATIKVWTVDDLMDAGHHECTALITMRRHHRNYQPPVMRISSHYIPCTTLVDSGGWRTTTFTLKAEDPTQFIGPGGKYVVRRSAASASCCVGRSIFLAFG